jgi:hypothetical protein
MMPWQIVTPASPPESARGERQPEGSGQEPHEEADQGCEPLEFEPVYEGGRVPGAPDHGEDQSRGDRRIPGMPVRLEPTAPTRFFAQAVHQGRFLGEPQYVHRLLTGDRGDVLQELIERLTRREVIDEILDGDSGS